MHLSDKVLCLGHRTDVEHLLNAADLTVLPSHFETFGLVLAEGMAMGKPAIAFSVGGTPEIVKDGETGFLVEKDNEKSCMNESNSSTTTDIFLNNFQKTAPDGYAPVSPTAGWSMIWKSSITSCLLNYFLKVFLKRRSNWRSQIKSDGYGSPLI